MKDKYIRELEEIRSELNKLSQKVFRSEIRYQKIKNLADKRELELMLRAKKIQNLLFNINNKNLKGV